MAVEYRKGFAQRKLHLQPYKALFYIVILSKPLESVRNKVAVYVSMATIKVSLNHFETSSIIG